MFKEFDTTLKKPKGIGGWSYFIVPFNAREMYGKKPHIRVKGTINGAPYHNFLLSSGDGTDYVIINKDVRDRMGEKDLENVHITMEIESVSNELIIPEDFINALENNIVAKNSFEHFPVSYKKELIDWISKARSKEIRTSRINRTIRNIIDGKPIKS